MSRAWQLLLLGALLLLGGCGGGSATPEASSEREIAVEAGEDSAAMEEPMAAGGSSAFDAEAALPAQAQLNRKIIYTAYLQLRVDDPRVRADALQAVAARYGGYVSNANVREVGDDSYRATVEIRVNAEQFSAALADIRAASTEVLDERIETADVTDQFVDLSARIENLERTETELQLLLTEARERGGDTEDVLRIYRELTGLREEIERYQGQLNLLNDQVSLATITVEMVPPEAVVEIVNEGWSASRIVRQATRALTGALQTIATLGIYGVILVLPVLLLLGLAFFLFSRLLLWLRYRNRRANSP